MAMNTISSRIATGARWFVVFSLLTVATLTAKAGTISPSDIGVEIATNMVWLDNSTNPLVGVLDSQQNFFDRLVTESSPLMRITNKSNHLRFIGGQLSLENSSARITDIQFLEAPGKTNWFWDGPDAFNDKNHAHFQFIDPLLPGGTVTMRFLTAQREDGYTMEQNLFTSLPQYGILKIGVDESLSREQVRFDPITHRPLGLEDTQIRPGFMFDLSTIPVRRYDSGVSDYAVTLAAQPVPEPSGLVLLGAALAALAGWKARGFRRLGNLAKA